MRGDGCADRGGEERVDPGRGREGGILEIGGERGGVGENGKGGGGVEESGEGGGGARLGVSTRSLDSPGAENRGLQVVQLVHAHLPLNLSHFHR